MLRSTPSFTLSNLASWHHAVSTQNSTKSKLLLRLCALSWSSLNCPVHCWAKTKREFLAFICFRCSTKKISSPSSEWFLSGRSTNTLSLIRLSGLRSFSMPEICKVWSTNVCFSFYQCWGWHTCVSIKTLNLFWFTSQKKTLSPRDKTIQELCRD